MLSSSRPTEGLAQPSRPPDPDPLDINIDSSTHTDALMHLCDLSDDLPSKVSARSKRRQVKRACVHCRKACKKCDEFRPCLRCIRYGSRDECVDATRKERKKGIKRGPYKKRDKGNKPAEKAAESPQQAFPHETEGQPIPRSPSPPDSLGIVDSQEMGYPPYRPSAPPPLAFVARPVVNEANIPSHLAQQLLYQRSHLPAPHTQPVSSVSPDGAQYSLLDSAASSETPGVRDGHQITSSWNCYHPQPQPHIEPYRALDSPENYRYLYYAPQPLYHDSIAPRAKPYYGYSVQAQGS